MNLVIKTGFNNKLTSFNTNNYFKEIKNLEVQKKIDSLPQEII